MRSFHCLASLIFVSVLAATGQNKLPYTISITPDKPTVVAGHDAWIDVTLTNNSDHAIDCTAKDVAGVDRTFQYEVKNSLGKSAEKADMHPETYSGSYQLCTLAPGKSITRQTRINFFHDLSVPGTYTVQLSRYISQNKNDPPVVSNTATIIVAPNE